MYGDAKKCSETIHIGNLIEQRLKQEKHTAAWLARQIPCTYNHIYKVFRKQSIDTKLLLRISKVLRFDFFQYYSSEIAANNTEWEKTHVANVRLVGRSDDTNPLT